MWRLYFRQTKHLMSISDGELGKKIEAKLDRQIARITGHEYNAGIEDGKKDNDGWIPVEERLPDVFRKIEEDSECPEYNVTIPGAEKATTLKYSPADETWFDDLGYVYPVIAWRPLPESYRPERSDNHDRK